jgi:pantoate kinase
MRVAKAFAPANISCIFRIYGKGDKRGSLGTGFTLDKGALVSVKIAKETDIRVNGKKVRFRTVRSVIKKLTDIPVRVDIKNEVPFGAGFGMSGACALATAYALNKLLGLEKSEKKLAMVAHLSEVENGTGLGDVGGQFNGGFMIKVKRGKPLDGKRLNILEQDVYYKVYGSIETKRVINSESKKKRINKAGDKALKKISKLDKISFGKLIEISKEFSVDSGLLKNSRVLNKIENINKEGGSASMIMLGEAVYSNIPFKGCKKACIGIGGAYLI